MSISPARLRSLEKKWEKEGKSKDKIRKLRWWHKNKKRLLEERRTWKG